MNPQPQESGETPSLSYINHTAHCDSPRSVCVTKIRGVRLINVRGQGTGERKGGCFVDPSQHSPQEASVLH